MLFGLVFLASGVWKDSENFTMKPEGQLVYNVVVYNAK